MHGTAPSANPLPMVVGSPISLTGTAKPTEDAKKKRTAQRTMRFIWPFQMACERGTLTKHMPATKAPRRWEPMMTWTEVNHPKKQSVQTCAEGTQREVKEHV